MKPTVERQVATIPGTLVGVDIKHLWRYQMASILTYNKVVYDVASGAGYGSLLLKAKKYYGFDNSKEAVAYATKYYGNKNVKFTIADACKMPNKLDKADVIVCFETIEHIKDPEAFIKWAATHCRVFIISTPIRYSFPKNPFHIFEYRLKVFVEVLEKYFTNVQIFVQDKDGKIIFPCRSRDKGVAFAICQAR